MSRISSSMYKRKKDLKRGIRFTIMVCGGSGTGKTTFINSLLDQNLLPHKFDYANLKPGNTVPKTITFSNLNAVIKDAAEFEKKFEPSLANQEPGIAITETSVEIVDEDDSKVLLTIIDTPGFGENIDNSICCTELCNFLEQQFDLVLGEETKVRRNPRFEDTRVHVCLYFIQPTGHGLRELDVQTMTKISKYVNVIPVIGRSDSFTKNELINFKRNINQDIERFKIPVFQFQFDEDEDDPDMVEESRYLSQLQPFALITSDFEGEIDGKKTRIRNYPWGSIDINNTSVSDFPILKSVLLGSHLQDFKDITHDFLYEAYRTEKLSSVADLQEDFTDSSISREPPSMSNLAEIANSQSMAKFNIEHQKNDVTGLSAKMSSTTLNENSDSESLTSSKVQKQKIRSMVDVKPRAPKISSPNLSHRQSYSFQNDDELSSFIENKGDEEENDNADQVSTSTATPTLRGPNSPSLSMNNGSSSPVVDPKKLRKISETVPYMLRHETLRSKQQKLEELERQSAVGLAKRAAELEKKAKELKMREKLLKERLNQKTEAKSGSNSSLAGSEVASNNGDSESKYVDTTSE